MFEDLKNQFDFFIRNKTKFSRKDFVEKKTKLLERNRLENLYTEDVLKQFCSANFRERTNVLDIGCKNWFYAKGEYDFFKTFSKEVFLDGVEIDPYRLYSNFYSRYEVAKFYIKDLENTNYIVGNLLDLKNKYDYIIWILPFVFEEPHLYWGLPKKFFSPQKMLEHAYSLLNKNGEMLIINQGIDEAREQEKLLKSLDITYKNIGEIQSKYYNYQNKRFGFLVFKN